MVRKRKTAAEYSNIKLENAYRNMSVDIEKLSISSSITTLFELAWSDFVKSKFAYDIDVIASKQTNCNEWILFILEWLNACGFVGKRVNTAFVLIKSTTDCSNIDFLLFCIKNVIKSWCRILSYKISKKLKRLEQDETILFLLRQIRKDILTK